MSSNKLLKKPKSLNSNLWKPQSPKINKRDWKDCFKMENYIKIKLLFMLTQLFLNSSKRNTNSLQKKESKN